MLTKTIAREFKAAEFPPAGSNNMATTRNTAGNQSMVCLRRGLFGCEWDVVIESESSPPIFAVVIADGYTP